MQPVGQRVAGMTLHDYFAAAALTGMLASDRSASDFSAGEYAQDAYRIADAMLKERDK
jgi:hypothetical protein